MSTSKKIDLIKPIPQPYPAWRENKGVKPVISDPSASARTIGEDTIKGTMKRVPKQWGTMLGGRQMKDKTLLDLKDLEKQRDEMLRKLRKKKATNRNRTIWPDALADVQKSLTLADCTAELKEDLLAVNNDEALIFNERLKIREKIKSKLNAFRHKEISTVYQELGY